jgi:menaquinone-dependent protoporphyrinogen IX oxidase
MSSMVIVYVTRSGHSRRIAEELGTLAGVQAVEIGDPVPRRGFFGYMRTGASAARKQSSPISDPQVDLSRADAVALVAPVWASSVCPPIRSWINAHRAELAGKKIGLLLSNLGSPGEPLKKAFEEEFSPLSSFDVLRQRLGGEEKSRRIRKFYESLAN